jgi:choline transport protein
MSIGCVLYRRIAAPDTLPPAKYSLGRWGIPVNIFACAYSVLAFVFSCFPIELPVDAASANYAPAIFAVVLLIAVLSFAFHGRTRYFGPVVYVEGRRAAGVGFQKTS